jgi:hypothetical protein
LVTTSPARSTKAIWISVARPPSLTRFPSQTSSIWCGTWPEPKRIFARSFTPASCRETGTTELFMATPPPALPRGWNRPQVGKGRPDNELPGATFCMPAGRSNPRSAMPDVSIRGLFDFVQSTSSGLVWSLAMNLVSRDEEEAQPMTLTHVNAPTRFVEANERGAHGPE